MKFACPKCGFGYRQRSPNSRCPKCGYRMSRADNQEQAIYYLIGLAICGFIWVLFQIASKR